MSAFEEFATVVGVVFIVVFVGAFLAAAVRDWWGWWLRRRGVR